MLETRILFRASERLNQCIKDSRNLQQVILYGLNWDKYTQYNIKCTTMQKGKKMSQA